ncbi:DUF3526 domain-containing protein [Methylomonas koyamae]|uniref:Uncharacterized protein n=1 Tax=Methylomonas koyamae TaxID=702114 RepID=A0A291IJ09_9GAMM|nr:DUF3526 domain-containing protein [Methylomonas koyamae]ATG90385.1 hypothetical protein MKLM6_2158 [Methylomonas koyamae]OAI26699.1 hypothetical protein A1356_00760 [Methylomonas koyamae]WNB77966.1 DUF3526 domain-containing protein [Methylomonas koyamae]
MIATVMRKELLTTLRDGRLLVLGLSLLALFAAFFLLSTHQLQAQRLEKQRVGATAKEQWNSQSVKNPHSAAHYGIYVFKPDLPAAAIDQGLTPFTGQSLWLEPHKRNLTRFNPSADDVLANRFGQAGSSFVLYALLPLLIVALSFNSVSQERERGTLRMLHSLGVTPLALLFGKLSGLLAAFWLVMSPAVLLAALTLACQFDLTADDLMRLSLLLVGLVAYYTIFAALSIAASAYFRTSRNTLFCLLGFWMGSVFVAPRLGAVIGDVVAPNPSASEFWDAIKTDIAQGLPGEGNKQQREKAFEAQVLAQYGVAGKEQLPVGFVSLNRQFNDTYSSKVHQLHFDRLRDNFAKQQQLAQLAGWLGPSLALRSLSMAIAGTDLAHQRDFEDAAEDYRRYFIDLTEEWDRERSRGTERSAKAEETDWRSVRDFAYTVPTVGYSLRASLLPLSLLSAWLCAALWLLAQSARRLQP